MLSRNCHPRQFLILPLSTFALISATFASLRGPDAGRSHQRHRGTESRPQNKQIKEGRPSVQPGPERSLGWRVLGRPLQKTLHQGRGSEGQAHCSVSGNKGVLRREDEAASLSESSYFFPGQLCICSTCAPAHARACVRACVCACVCVRAHAPGRARLQEFRLSSWASWDKFITPYLYWGVALRCRKEAQSP